jgi:N-acetylmuramic acid 6-phosphate etherase
MGRPSERVVAPTEDRNPATIEIDQLSIPEALELINREDQKIAAAVAAVLPALAAAVELGLAALNQGGRIHYAGAGASGRVGFLDRAELVPTYGVDPDLFVAHLAGGLSAMVASAEGVEDDEAAGEREVAETIAAGDLLVGLAASGRTPYVGGALQAARSAKAATVLITANPDAPLAELAHVHIGVDTGPEVITGSTRMKAATAQKMVLNAFSTTLMVQRGRTYSNLMTHMDALNSKLRGRSVRVLEYATGRGEADCGAALDAAGGDIPVALVHMLAQVDIESARDALAQRDRVVRAALTAVQREPAGQ